MLKNPKHVILSGVKDLLFVLLNKKHKNQQMLRFAHHDICRF